LSDDLPLKFGGSRIQKHWNAVSSLQELPCFYLRHLWNSGKSGWADLYRRDLRECLAHSCWKLRAAGFLGIDIDPEVNANVSGTEGVISSAGSRVNVCVIPTNESCSSPAIA
jgi:hypothetical protein